MDRAPFAAGENREIVVASFNDDKNEFIEAGIWAPKLPESEQRTFQADYRSIVEIEVQDGTRVDTYQVLVANMNHDIQLGRNFYVLTQDENLFAT